MNKHKKHESTHPPKDPKRALLWVIRVCAVLAVATPFVVLDTMVVDSALAFQVVVEVMFVAWVLLALRYPAYRPNWRNPVVIAVSAFLLALLITLPFSIGAEKSFWSSALRMMGVVNYLHYGAWFFVLVSSLKSWKEWRYFLLGVVGVGVLVSVYGFFPGGLNGKGRVVSFLNNPLHLGAYVLLQIFLSALLFVKEERTGWKWGLGTVILVHVVALFQTASRSAAIGLLVPVGLAAVAYIFVVARKRLGTFWAMTSLAAVCVGGIALVAFFVSQAGRAWALQDGPYVLQRFYDTQNLYSRFVNWEIAWIGIMERPFFGWGLEQFSVLFDTYLNRAGPHEAVWDPWSSRAHNQFIDMWVATGVVGLAAYLSMWVVSGYQLVKSWMRDSGADRLVACMLLLTLCGYAVQLFFFFDIPAATALFFLLIAYVGWWTGERGNGRARNHASDLARNTAFRLAVPGLVIILLMTQWHVNIAPWFRAVQAEYGLKLIGKDPAVAQRLSKKAMTDETFLRHDIRYQMLDNMARLSTRTQYPPDALKSIILQTADSLQETAHIRSYDYKAAIAAAQGARLAGAVDEAWLDVAETHARRAQSLTRYRPEAIGELTEIAYERGEYARAADLAHQTLERTSDKYKNRNGRTYFLLARISAQEEDFERAFAYYDTANIWEYPVQRDVRFLNVLGERLPVGAHDRAIRILQSTAPYFPENHVDILKNSALMYAKVGQTDAARSSLEALENVAPEVAQHVRDHLNK